MILTEVCIKTVSSMRLKTTETFKKLLLVADLKKEVPQDQNHLPALLGT